MWLPSWLRTQKRHGFPRPRPAFRPDLEALEDRCLPSTLTVTNNLDNGSKGSLRYEIARAHNKDTIVFAPSLGGQTITLSSGELLITDSGLTIKGPGANLLAVSGGHTSRVFEVAANVKATISGLTISNGVSDDGGAILNGGVLTLTGCTVSGNSALLDGGAIYNNGVLTLTGCTVSGNSAADSGGGIYNPFATNLTLSGCILSNNTAQVDGGALYNGGGATVSSCTVSGNSVSAIPGSVGGGIYTISASLTVSNTSFSGNVPDNIAGDYTDGGGNMFH
jgi:predicted outer membrane repeat protein